MSEEKKQPLNLPQGSIRAIISVLLVIAFIVYGLIYQTFPEPLIGILGMVIGYYFARRANEDK
jgi:hypothetical protein